MGKIKPCILFAKRQATFLFVFLGLFVNIYAKPVVIQGYIHTKDKDPLYLYTYRSIGDYIEGMSEAASCEPDSSGFFQFKYELKKGNEFTLKNGDNYIFFNVFFSPGDSLKINMSDHSTEFDGSGQNNVYYNDSFPKVFYMGAEREQYQNAFKMPLDSFNTYIDARKEMFLGFLDKFSQTKPLSKAFIAHSKQYIEYQWAVDKLQYLWKYKYYHQLKEVVDAKPGYFDFIARLNLQNKPEMDLVQYYYCLKDYATEIWEQKLLHHPYKDQYKFNNQIRDRLSVIDSLYRGKIKLIAYCQVIDDVLKWPGTYDSSKVMFTDSLLNILQNNRQAQKMGLYDCFVKEKDRSFSLVNKPAPDFKLGDLRDSTVSLSDFKGKVVLLDFWSVHCGPCIKEIPNSNALQDKLKGRKFVVVTVCFDSDMKEWQDMIAKHKWEGVHLFNAYNEQLKDRYFFNEFPHYVLIDKYGIVRESNASTNIQNLESNITDLLKN